MVSGYRVPIETLVNMAHQTNNRIIKSAGSWSEGRCESEHRNNGRKFHHNYRRKIFMLHRREEKTELNLKWEEDYKIKKIMCSNNNFDSLNIDILHEAGRCVKKWCSGRTL